MSDQVRQIEAALRQGAREKRWAEANFKKALQLAYSADLSNGQIAAATGETHDCVRVRRRRDQERAAS